MSGITLMTGHYSLFLLFAFQMLCNLSDFKFKYLKGKKIIFHESFNNETKTTIKFKIHEWFSFFQNYEYDLFWKWILKLKRV